MKRNLNIVKIGTRMFGSSSPSVLQMMNWSDTRDTRKNT